MSKATEILKDAGIVAGALGLAALEVLGDEMERERKQEVWVVMKDVARNSKIEDRVDLIRALAGKAEKVSYRVECKIGEKIKEIGEEDFTNSEKLSLVRLIVEENRSHPYKVERAIREVFESQIENWEPSAFVSFKLLDIIENNEMSYRDERHLTNLI